MRKKGPGFNTAVDFRQSVVNDLDDDAGTHGAAAFTDSEALLTGGGMQTGVWEGNGYTGPSAEEPHGTPQLKTAVVGCPQTRRSGAVIWSLSSPAAPASGDLCPHPAEGAL